MPDLDPGYYRAENQRNDSPPAYFQVTESDKAVLVYPSGEVHRNDAAILLLLRSDVLPASTVEAVPREETPFEDDVEPRPPTGPDPAADTGV